MASRNEEMYRGFFDALEESCCIFDVVFDPADPARAIDCVSVACNAAFTRETKNTDGKNGLALVPDAERHRHWIEIYGRVVRTGESVRLDYEGADQRWFEISVSRLGAADASRVVVRFEEISARRDAERKHRDAQIRLESTLNAGEVGTWDWKIREDEVYADRNLARLFSVSRADADGGPSASYVRAVHPDDRARLEALLETCLRSGEFFEAEYRLITEAGDVRWVIARGRPHLSEDGVALNLPGVVLDVTQERAAKAALEATEVRLHVALAAGHMGTWELDLAAMNLIASDTCKSNYGIAPGQPFTYEILTAAVLDEDRAEWQRKVQTAIARVEDFDHEYRTRWPDGSVHWVHVRASCATDAEGRTISMSGISARIDERKEAEEALRASDRQKDEFLATASHELRTPLNAILGWSRMLRSGSMNAATQLRGLETIERNAQAQVRLIEDILDGSRILTGKLQMEIRPLDMAVVVTSAIEGVRPAAIAKGIDLSVTLDPEASRVFGDPERLQQIVWNLASNAIKFTPRGGRVTVALRRDGGDIELSISDSGEGIGATFLPHVFERFRQADGSTTRRHGGLGLGLALVRHLTEAHGGTVRAESAGLGLGATFVVSLPVQSAHAEPGPIVERRSASALPVDLAASEPLDGISVLVVDDEEDARELVAMVLTESGAEVRIADSAASALDAIAARLPSVLVSDIGMPKMDGYELLRRVRRVAGHDPSRLPAIALTAYARDQDRKAAADAGFQAHLAKPVEPKELVRMVARLALATAGTTR